MYATSPPCRDVPARNALVESNLGLPGALLTRLGLGGRQDYDDLWQAAVLGLMRAAEVFDPERGAFSTCANVHMMQKVRLALHGADMVRIPQHICGEERAELRRQLRPVALPGMADGKDGPARHSGRPADYRESETVAIDHAEDMDALRAAVARLPAWLGRVLHLHFWEGCKLREIGAELGVTKERVRQLVKQGVALLAKRMRAAG